MGPLQPFTTLSTTVRHLRVGDSMEVALAPGIDLGKGERRNYSSPHRVEDTGWIAHTVHTAHIGRMETVRRRAPLAKRAAPGERATPGSRQCRL